MHINPTYAASVGVKQLFHPNDTIYAIQKVDPLFDRNFNYKLFKLCSEGNEIRERYVHGRDINDTENDGNTRYHIMTS